MTTRRIVKTDQDVLAQDVASSPSVEKKPEQFGAVPRHVYEMPFGGLYTDMKKKNDGPTVKSTVVAKLIFFTMAMISGPLMSYYASNTFIFPGNSTAAAAIAAVVANLVLVGYIIAAITEDDTDQTEQKKAQ